MRNLKIIVTVVDKTQKPLEQVEKRVRKTGAAAKSAALDFTKFNRILFTTSAFVGTFVKGFSTLTNSIEEGANFDRLVTQFERVMGPKGQLFDSISSMTDASIDKMEAMREGLSLGSLGIIKNSSELAAMVTKAGVASKLAGKDSGEGIKQFSSFLKDGNVSHLEFFNLIARTNPALQAQMAILGKAGGIMGTVVTTQARLAMGQALLSAATKGQLKGFRDLKDTVADYRQNLLLLKNNIGTLLGKALQPLIDSFSRLLEKSSNFIDSIKDNKQVRFLIKFFTVAAGATLGLAGALGTLRLAVMALGSLGFGLPRLIALGLGLGTTFLGITKPVSSFADKLKLIGAVVKGVWELISTLDSETGIAKLSESTYKLLKQNGLLGFVQFLGRVGSVAKTVVLNMFDAFKWLGKKLDDVFGGMFQTVIKFFQKINDPWSNWWVNDSVAPIEKGMRAATVIVSTFAALWMGKKMLGGIAGVLSKIPVIGKLFGGAGKGTGPTGDATDPIFTVPIGGGLAGGIPGLGKAKDAIFGRLGKILGPLSLAFQNLLLRSKILGEIFTHPGGKLRGLMSVFGSFGKSFLSLGRVVGTSIMAFGSTILTSLVTMFSSLAPLLGPAIAVTAAAGIGYAIGTAINTLIAKYTQGETEEGFKGDLFERAGFKVNKLFGGEWSKREMALADFQKKSDVDIVNEFRKKNGQPPLTADQEQKLRESSKSGPTVPTSSQLMTPMKQTSSIIPDSVQSELESLNQLGENMQNTPSSDATVMKNNIEKMLASGKEPQEVASQLLGSKLDDTNYYLEVIAGNTGKSQSLQTNPMTKRER
jgi:hypothetical protein